MIVCGVLFCHVGEAKLFPDPHSTEVGDLWHWSAEKIVCGKERMECMYSQKGDASFSCFLILV